MPECSCCKKDMERQKKSPRDLVRLPISVVSQARNASMGNLFRDQTTPIFMCDHCDGDALDSARREHKISK